MGDRKFMTCEWGCQMLGKQRSAAAPASFESTLPYVDVHDNQDWLNRK